MRGLALLLGAALALGGCGGAVKQPAKAEADVRLETLQLKAADGVAVYGTYVEPADPHAVILLFHQAGSGQGEYATIVPRLTAEGYAVLTIDQRSGGDMFGGNWTVKALGREAGYLDARKDLEAALAWAQAKKRPVILWGSSYSASLAFLVAADHPGQVAGLLAFSPDEYFEGKPSVGDAAKKLTIPVFVTSSQEPDEIAAAKALIDAVPSPAKRQFMPTQGGVHGSSILIAKRNPQGADAAWAAVMPFLRGIAR
ncbi:alpha/beta hydrolase [Sphingomonas sp. AOB5]|uniref:alpha/beta hydrolase n=1 Tax=Sphingomonas sp. AOB5 TaxID=3034017 RepID=UPI0023F7D5DF|nr:alpha/beta hydrolase [Sphingomonas sp. AOB5]MDF7774643.1 alpha/beta hydrolase [Sphingomonas sp. AOB5]